MAEKSTYTASGFNYFGCKVCNVRGIPYTAQTLTVHLDTRSHKIMKALYDNGLWPGPPEKYECSERKPQVYKFLDSRGTVLCETCNKVLPDAQSLFKHQQSEEHRKILKDKDLDVPMIYMCEVCDVILCGLENYYNHCWGAEHLTAVEKLKATKKDAENAKKSDETKEVKTEPGDGENQQGTDENSQNSKTEVMSEVCASDSSDNSNHSLENAAAANVKLETTNQENNEDASSSLVNSENIKNLLSKLQNSAMQQQNTQNILQDYLAQIPVNSVNAVAAKILKSGESAFETTTSFSPCSTASSVVTPTPTQQPAVTLTPSPEKPSEEDQQRINALLASLAAGMKQNAIPPIPPPPEQPPPANLLELLLQKTAESNMTQQVNWLSQLLASQQQQQQQQQQLQLQQQQQQMQARQQKLEAMNQLDYVINAYLTREAQYIQMKQAKLQDLASLRQLICECRDKGNEFEMTVQEMSRLTDAITTRLNTVQQPEVNIFAEVGCYQQQAMQQQQHQSPQLQVSPTPNASAAGPSLNEYFATLITSLAAAAATAGAVTTEDVKPRFVNTDSLMMQQQQHHQNIGRNINEPPRFSGRNSPLSSCLSRERATREIVREKHYVSIRKRSRSRSVSPHRSHYYRHSSSSSRRSPQPSHYSSRSSSGEFDDDRDRERDRDRKHRYHNRR